MKNKKRSNLLTSLTALVLAAFIIQFGARSAQGQCNAPGGNTFATDSVTIKQGQTARLQVTNPNDQSLIVWLFFLDSVDNVLVKKQVKIKPGGIEAIELTGPNNPLSPNGISADFPLRAAALAAPEIQGLVLANSSLRITEKGQTVRLIGSDGFKEVNIPTDPCVFPNDGPPLTSAELRPGNDPAPPKASASNGFPADFRVTEVFLKADDGRPTGPCPLRIVFRGYITANGPGAIKYTFTRSDGATGPIHIMEFKSAGTQAVMTDWTVGDPTVLPRYAGWQAVKVLSPVEMESSHDTGSFEIACTTEGQRMDLTRPNPTGDGTNPVQPSEKISPEVMSALQASQQDEQVRAAARQRSLEAERAQFEPAANAIVEAVKRSNVDLENYLAASKQFVESTDPKQFDINGINQRFSDPIRAAIDKAVGLPGVADFLQRPVSPPVGAWPAPGQPDPNGNGGASNTSCPGCETVRFEPPFEGLASEGDFGTRSIRPGPVRELLPQVRGAVLSAPHSRKGSGRTFTVPASARHVTVTVNLGSSWNIGLSGLGYAHVWLGLDMNVTTGGSAVCSAPHLEQDNFWTVAGGILTMSSRPPVPNFTRTCTFDRRPGDPTTYAANIFASVDGTFFGASSGFGDYKVVLGRVDVTYCP